MWGIKTYKDRSLSEQIFNLLINETISKQYLHLPKGTDQLFLKNHVYDHIKNVSLIHDSYNCMRYNDSEPWPTRRYGNCRVGAKNECSEKSGNYIECPVRCRPKSHLDWIYC
jgi:hypothetical protein